MKMALLTDSYLVDAISIIIALIVITVTYLKRRLSIWKRLGVPYIEPEFPYGNTKSSLQGNKSVHDLIPEFYKRFKAKGERHAGIYLGTAAFYLPIEIDLVKQILLTDFSSFMNHGLYFNEKDDPLSGHLFNLEDTKWRNMRVKLTPTFTSGKMRHMFQTLADCTVGLKEIMAEAATSKNAIDIKDILGRFTTDIIGSAAFGIECNTLKNPDSEFRVYGKKVFQVGGRRLKRFMMGTLSNDILRAFGVTTTLKDVENFFMKTVKEVVEYREKNNIYRKDFMHLLIQLKNRGKVTDDGKIKAEVDEQEAGLTMGELSAQAFVFFLAGFETSSTTMTFALYQLASNPDVQQKLRDEINRVMEKHNNVLSYDAIMEMTYMDKVLSETLRMYPPVSFLFRKSNKDWTIPGTDILLEKGTNVAIPARAIHHDPEYYPEPEKFDPHRFDEDVKNARPACTWLPFGDGPRLCIGLRFGLMQSKVGLTALLKDYVVSLNEKTLTPMEMDPNSGVLSAKGGIWINVEKINA